MCTQRENYELIILLRNKLTHMHVMFAILCCVRAFFLQDQDKEYVGFATLPNQVHRKTVKKGFTFTLMVAGECYEDLLMLF